MHNTSNRLFITIQRLNFIYRLFLIGAFIILCLSCLSSSGEDKNKHHYWTPYKTIATGLSWPKGQALPQFASPANTLDGLDMRKCGKEFFNKYLSKIQT